MSTQAAKPPISSSRGFSLAEIMVVVSLIALAGTISFSTLLNYGEQYRVKNAAVLVSAELEKLRMEAIRTRTCQFFERTSTTQFRLVRDNTAAPNCTLGGDDTVIKTINIATLFPGVRFDQGSNDTDPFGAAVSGPSPTSMRFEPRGLVTTVGGSSIFVKNNNFGPWAVTVTAAGAVRAWRKDGTAWK